MFKAHKSTGIVSSKRRDIMYENLVTGNQFPALGTMHLDVVGILENIGHNVDEDFYFLERKRIQMTQNTCSKLSSP